LSLNRRGTWPFRDGWLSAAASAGTGVNCLAVGARTRGCHGRWTSFGRLRAVRVGTTVGAVFAIPAAQAVRPPGPPVPPWPPLAVPVSDGACVAAVTAATAVPTTKPPPPPPPPVAGGGISRRWCGAGGIGPDDICATAGAASAASAASDRAAAFAALSACRIFRSRYPCSRRRRLCRLRRRPLRRRPRRRAHAVTVAEGVSRAAGAAGAAGAKAC